MYGGGGGLYILACFHDIRQTAKRPCFSPVDSVEIPDPPPDHLLIVYSTQNTTAVVHGYKLLVVGSNHNVDVYTV
jgi:hypothetical protein